VAYRQEERTRKSEYYMWNGVRAMAAPVNTTL
jgi:hypothetical protein